MNNKRRIKYNMIFASGVIVGSLLTLYQLNKKAQLKIDEFKTNINK